MLAGPTSHRDLAREKAMRKNVRKWMIAGLVAMMAAPALAGCVATVGPGYYHGYHGYHDRGHDGGRHGYWR
jgi:uncharacterized membrane protein